MARSVGWGADSTRGRIRQFGSEDFAVELRGVRCQEMSRDIRFVHVRRTRMPNEQKPSVPPRPGIGVEGDMRTRVGTRDGTTIHQNLNQKNVPSPNWKSVCSFPSSQIDAPAQVRDFDEIATHIYIWHLTSELTRWGHCGWWWRGAPVWCRRSQKTSMDDQRHWKTINSDHWPFVSYLSFLFVIASDFFEQAEAEEAAEEEGQGRCSAYVIWVAIFSGCRKMDKVGTPQVDKTHSSPRRRLPCRRCRLRRHWRRHWCRLVLAYTA